MFFFGIRIIKNIYHISQRKSPKEASIIIMRLSKYVISRNGYFSKRRHYNYKYKLDFINSS